MSRVHLSPRVYSWCQNFVHRGHFHTYERLCKLMEICPGEPVVEIGCGAADVGRHFVAAGFPYWGVDRDAERIREAERQVPGGRFLVGDVVDLQALALPSFGRAFIHGVLHHLDDKQCRLLLEPILSRPDVTLAIIEPYAPDPWWHNPLGRVCAWMDEGRHVRTLDEWLEMFGPHLEHWETRALWPRWPVPFLDARLRSRQNAGRRVLA